MPSAIVILAAGASTRLGKPKQLLRYRGITLLEHACQIALSADPQLVSVVLGAAEDELGPFVPEGVQIVSNPNWVGGISTSIQAGIGALPAAIQVAALMLVDQPLITSEHLRTLLSLVSDESLVTASQYPDGTPGVPAAFHRSVFPDLFALKGDLGAKAVLLALPELRTVDLSLPLDIDTPDDYTKLGALESP